MIVLVRVIKGIEEDNRTDATPDFSQKETRLWQAEKKFIEILFPKTNESSFRKV